MKNDNIAIIPLKGTHDLAQKIEKQITLGEKITLNCQLHRFQTGEGKASLSESVKNRKVYILIDVCNYNEKYQMIGKDHNMSPDDHYQDLKRVISAIKNKTKEINVIMPYLYEGRQHHLIENESFDCLDAIKELEFLGVKSVITVDIHDPELIEKTKILKNINIYKNLSNNIIKNKKLIIVAPDEGAVKRANVLKEELNAKIGFFQKKKDKKTTDGTNKIIDYNYVGPNISKKDVLIVDDIIASGQTIINAIKCLKKYGANHIYIFSTFGLFTAGLYEFDKLYDKKMFDKIICTNLVYQSDDLKTKKYYQQIDMSEVLVQAIYN